ncbi:hypothetical protein [Streptomyces melanogenes]
MTENAATPPAGPLGYLYLTTGVSLLASLLCLRRPKSGHVSTTRRR